MTVHFRKLWQSAIFSRFQAIAETIDEAYENLPMGVRFFARPMFYLALGLHLTLLFAPAPGKTDPPEPEPEPSPTPETVKITRLPPPQERPKEQPQASPQATPKPAATPLTPQATPLSAPPPPLAPPAVPTPQTQESPEPEAPDAPPEEPSPSPDEAQTPDSTQPPPPKTLGDFYSQLPQYPGASAGSGGVLRPDFDDSGYIYNADSSVDAVGSQFQQLFANTEFTISPAVTGSEFQVYAVTLGTLTQYLHLVPKDGKTAMVMMDRSYSLEELQTAQTDELDPNIAAFEGITQQFGSDYGERLRSPERNELLEAGQFADNQKFDLRSMTAAAFLQPPSPDEIVNFFAQRFATDGFSFTQVGNYGGGPAYQVTREDFNRCIIFPPTNIPSDDAGTPGTAVVLAESCP
ncbi:MAG: hypothetical protein SW833_05300 [Cyanobacteriota bacterium]|nr:hypothetical protein [Cyanobacteriota bacterium]